MCVCLCVCVCPCVCVPVRVSLEGGSCACSARVVNKGPILSGDNEMHITQTYGKTYMQRDNNHTEGQRTRTHTHTHTHTHTQANTTTPQWCGDGPTPSTHRAPCVPHCLHTMGPYGVEPPDRRARPWRCVRVYACDLHLWRAYH